jgi:cell division transport system permease protein
MNAVRDQRRPAPEPEKTRRTTPRHVGAWREHHLWSLSISWRRLAARPIGTLLTVAVMGVALALPLAFYLLLGNVERMGDALGRNQSISAFMKPGQNAGMAETAASALRGRPEVADIVVRTPQDGLAELAEVQGFSGSLQSLDDNPLPYVLSVQPKPGLSADDVARLIEAMKATPGVDTVQDTGAWRQRLDALVGVGRRAVTLLALLLGVAALLVVGNTIRVDILSRSEEIAVLLLIGASRPFVRRPYLYAGIWLGLLAGVLAVLLAVVLELAMAGPVSRLAAAYDGSVSFGGLPAWLLLSVPVASAVLGWLGARLVSARQIRRAAAV